MVGRKWLEKHDVLVDPSRRRLLFHPEHLPDPECWKNANISLDASPAPPKRTSPALLEDIRQRDKRMEKEDQRRRAGFQVSKRIAELEAATVANESSVRKESEPERPKIAHILSRHDPLPKDAKKAVRFDPVAKEEKKMDRALQEDTPRPPEPAPRRKEKPVEDSKRGIDVRGPYVLKRDSVGWYKERPPDIAIIGAVAFTQLAHRDREAVGCTSLHEVDKLVESKIADSMPRDEEDLRRKAAEAIPECYHDYFDMFSKAESDDLPPRRTQVDHKIELATKPEELGYSPLYKLSLEELEAARKYITDNLRKGFIVPSDAP